MAAKIKPETITDTVFRLVKKYDEREPFKLAKSMGIIVNQMPLGVYEGCLKGLFVMHCRKKHITINSDLPEELQKVILAHELGHAVLHANAGAAPFHDTMFFDDVDTKEYEANLFASELLLSDEDVLSVLNDDNFFFEAAQSLNVPFELLDFKFRVMKRKGYKLEAPVVSHSDFLKKLEKELDPEQQRV